MPFLMSTHRSGGTLGGTPEAFAFTGMDIKKAPHTQGKVALVTPHLGERKGSPTPKGQAANIRALQEGLRGVRGRELARSDGDSEALRGHDGQMGHGSDLRGLALGRLRGRRAEFLGQFANRQPRIGSGELLHERERWLLATPAGAQLPQVSGLRVQLVSQRLAFGGSHFVVEG